MNKKDLFIIKKKTLGTHVQRFIFHTNVEYSCRTFSDENKNYKMERAVLVPLLHGILCKYPFFPAI